MRDLSVLIPARNEMFLKRTILDVLANRRADTDIIVVLDGEWATEPLDQHPDVTIVYLPKSIGQRASTNLAARLSNARYIMKLDAHCAVDEGFDVKLIEAAKELGPDVTQVPSQWNLHAFDWVCRSCESRMDQGPTPAPCGCGANDWYRDMVWARRRLTEAWRFDADLKFGYWGSYKDRVDEALGKQDFLETLSCLGACWFLSRARYWELGGMDEKHGSWGQMGTEIGCKSWLSGGKLVTNRRTWFAHMFRTQGGDFGFPYPLSMKAVEKARAHSQDMWRNGKWPLAKHDLKWLITKFWPVQGWTQEDLDAL